MSLRSRRCIRRIVSRRIILDLLRLSDHDDDDVLAVAEGLVFKADCRFDARALLKSNCTHMHALRTGYFIGGGLDNLLGGYNRLRFKWSMLQWLGNSLLVEGVVGRAPVVMLSCGWNEGGVIGMESSRGALKRMPPRLVGIEDVGKILLAELGVLRCSLSRCWARTCTKSINVGASGGSNCTEKGYKLSE
ncbi:hypothetical protein ARMSODRAFT_1028018 [Armillaria solidipes]|uniref:Uncharacterized protein n=1 Tax=Armillaria solidipes TaxID=1076256 RepID=A0A2H3AY91_9AGAR|nr:hypothetical protein ARMSODRAFT_1028018 [Armillaria solidipes]